ncbi:unnamed protein product [Ambrosiozyma monospora]|uniref:Unnamed protein product n=1 Tax=Ambrosiozyma monospora TaxID=43982 RepID=A0A9W7DID8_AMBMO|nr:unnamed protein product [Ambrosiozyma monospora]
MNRLNDGNLTHVNSHTQLAKTAHGVRILAKNLNRATIKLHMRSVMIITKARDNSLIYLTKELTEWLLEKNPHGSVYVDHHLENSKRFDAQGLINDLPSAKDRIKFWTKDLIRQHPDLFDLVITLGGDGTVLYCSTLFQKIVPPVMSFALGSLGFLTNFKFEDFRTVLGNALHSGVHTNLRMRFTCRVHKSNGELVSEQQVLNELTVDRGPSPWVSMLELYGDGSLLTVAQADGLILATPTGSTAYSLSAGGSLVHPSVSAISVTPICPHTLSFRPILLPDSMSLKVKVPLRSRATAFAAFDGRARVELLKGYYVSVYASPFPFPTVRSSKTEYIDSVSRVLNWNNREEQKSFVHLLSDKNKKSYTKYQKSHPDGINTSLDQGFPLNSPSYGSNISKLEDNMQKFKLDTSSTTNGISGITTASTSTTRTNTPVQATPTNWTTDNAAKATFHLNGDSNNSISSFMRNTSANGNTIHRPLSAPSVSTSVSTSAAGSATGLSTAYGCDQLLSDDYCADSENCGDDAFDAEDEEEEESDNDTPEDDDEGGYEIDYNDDD